MRLSLGQTSQKGGWVGTVLCEQSILIVFRGQGQALYIVQVNSSVLGCFSVSS